MGITLAGTTVVNCLMLSSMYVLMALGFAFLVSIMGILNFAHGAIYMVSGYICYQLTVAYGVNEWASFLLTVAIVGALGLFLEKYCFRPFSWNLDRIIVVCIAIILILETLVNVTVGVYVRALPSFSRGSSGPAFLRLGQINCSAFSSAAFFLRSSSGL